MENPDKPKDPVELPDRGTEKQNIDNPNVVEISIDDLLGDVLEKHAEHENAQRDKSTRKDLTSTELKEPQVLEIENNLHELNAIARTREKAILDPHTLEAKETKDRFELWREQWEKDHPEEKDELSTNVKDIEQRKDILTKEWSIHLEEEKVRERVAQSVFTIDLRKEKLLAPQQEIINKNGQLQRDLAAYPGGLRAFYREYDSALRESAATKGERMKELMANLGATLNSLHSDQPYEWKDIEKIFQSLTGPENEASASFILEKNIEKTEIADSYIIDPSGKVATAVDRIHSRTDLTPEKRRERLDSLFRGLSRLIPKIMKEDPERGKLLKEKFAELEVLKKVRKGIAEAFEKRRGEDAAKAGLKESRVEDIAAVIAGATTILLVVNGNEQRSPHGIPQEDQILFEELARTGYPELVLKIIKQDNPPLTKMEDGSYKAIVENEEVFLKPVNGTFSVFLKHGNRLIPIIAGESEDTGFDLAKSEKISLENEWANIANRPDIRYALLDAPADGHFMSDKEGGRFAGLLRILLKGHGTNSIGRLKDLHIINGETGRLDFRYIRAYKRTFEQWAKSSKGDSSERDGSDAFANLALTIRPGQINMLAESLKEQAKIDPQFDTGEIIEQSELQHPKN